MIPPLELLEFLKARLKKAPDEVPFVDLAKQCVPTWSSKSALQKERAVARLEGVNLITHHAVVAANALAGKK